MFYFLLIFFVYSENDWPKVSVVVPVYNRESLVSKCVSSILNQTLLEIEIIAVDDGSKDNTLEILNSIAENDIRIRVIHQENCGVSCARNAGLVASKGTYVTFVDSDDSIESDFLYIAYNKGKESSGDVVYCQYTEGKGNVVGPFEEKILKGSSAARYQIPCLKTPCLNLVVFARLYKRSLLVSNHIVFDEKIGYGEDVIFNLDVAPFVESVLLVNRMFYHQSRTPGGLNRQHTFQQEEDYCDVLLQHLSRIRDLTTCKYCFVQEDFKKLELYVRVFMETSKRRRMRRLKRIKKKL